MMPLRAPVNCLKLHQFTPTCSAEDLEQRQDLELPADIMHDLQEEAIVMSRMRVGP